MSSMLPQLLSKQASAQAASHTAPRRTSSMELLTALLPMLALILVRKLRPVGGEQQRGMAHQARPDRALTYPVPPDQTRPGTHQPA